MTSAEQDGAAEQDVEQLQDLKREAYRIRMETNGLKGQWKSETDQDQKGETRQHTKNGMGFHLREWGIGDKCGKALVLVQGGEEFVNGEVWLDIRGRKM